MSLTAVETKTIAIAAPKAVQKFWTEDEVSNREIFAYEKGKDHMKQQLKKKKDVNLTKAKFIAEAVIQELHNVKVNCKAIHLRQTTTSHFTSIFLIPQKDFLSVDSYSKIYQVATKRVSPELKNGFHFECMFMPYSKKLNEDAILADGFRWTFGEKPLSAK